MIITKKKKKKKKKKNQTIYKYNEISLMVDLHYSIINYLYKINYKSNFIKVLIYFSCTNKSISIISYFK